MKLSTRGFVPWIFGMVLGFAGAASAQPGNEPKAANPPVWNQGGGGDGNWQNMTPVQRQAAMKQFTTQMMTESLKRIGITDEKSQTTILQYVEAEEKTKETVREKARKLVVALADNTQTDERTQVLLEDLRAAIDEAKAARKEQEAKLEELTGYSKKPKLQAMLAVLGLVGDETELIHGFSSNFMNTVGLFMEQPGEKGEK